MQETEEGCSGGVIMLSHNFLIGSSFHVFSGWFGAGDGTQGFGPVEHTVYPVGFTFCFQ